MNFKQYIIFFEESGQGSSSGVSSVNLDDLLLRVKSASSVQVFLAEKIEFIKAAIVYAGKYLRKVFGKRYGKKVDFDDIVSIFKIKLLNFKKEDFDKIEVVQENSVARYLSGILAKTFIDEIRKVGSSDPKRARHDIEAINKHLGDKNAPEFDLEKQDDIEKALVVLDQLPDSYKSVLKCLILHNLSYDETSKFLNISIGTVGSLFNYAKRRLRTLMGVEEMKRGVGGVSSVSSSDRVTDAFKSALGGKDYDVRKPYSMYSGVPSDEELSWFKDPTNWGRDYVSQELQRKGIDPTMQRVLSEPRVGAGEELGLPDYRKRSSSLPVLGLPYLKNDLVEPELEKGIVRSGDIDPERQHPSIRIGPKERAVKKPSRVKIINPEPIDPEAWKSGVNPKFSEYLKKKEKEFEDYLKRKEKKKSVKKRTVVKSPQKKRRS